MNRVLEKVYCPLRQAQHVLELAHDDPLVQQVEKAHPRLADGDGDAQPQQPLEDRPTALGLVGAPEDGGPVAAVVPDHVEHGQHRASADAHDGARRADLQVLADIDQVPGQGQADEQLDKGLDELAHRRGHHVLPALGEAPVGAHDGHADHRHRQGLDGPVGHGVAHPGRQLLGEEEHGRRAHGPHRHKEGHGGVEAPAHLVAPPRGVGLADELAQGQGQAGGGQGQQEGVDVVGAGEVGDALVPQDVVQGDLVQRPADLHEHRGDGKDSDPAHKGLFGLILFSGHG